MKNKVILDIIKYIIIIFFLITLPFAIGIPNQSRDKLIVLNIAVDKIDEQYELSLQYLIPQNGNNFEEKTDITSAIAPNIASAIEKIEMNVGKSVGISHTNCLILSKAILEDEVFEIIDYFIRDKALGNYTVLLGAEGSAKDLLTISSQPQNISLNSLSKIILYNDEYNFEKSSTIQRFLMGYYSKSKTSNILMLSTKENKDATQQDNSQSQSNNSSDTSQSTNNKSIINDDKSSIFYDGKFITTIEGEEEKGFALINSPIKHATITLSNINDEYYTDARVNVNIEKTKIKRNLFFNNDTPIIEYFIDIKASLLSILDSKNQKSFYDYSKNYLTNTIKDALKSELKKYVMGTLSTSKKYNIDLFNAGELFFKYKPKEWEKYLKNLENSQNYIQNLEIFANFNIIAE